MSSNFGHGSSKRFARKNFNIFLSSISFAFFFFFSLFTTTVFFFYFYSFHRDGITTTLFRGILTGSNLSTRNANKS